jgi:hypothetical protein
VELTALWYQTDAENIRSTFSQRKPSHGLKQVRAPTLHFLSTWRTSQCTATPNLVLTLTLHLTLTLTLHLALALAMTLVQTLTLTINPDPLNAQFA